MEAALFSISDGGGDGGRGGGGGGLEDFGRTRGGEDATGRRAAPHFAADVDALKAEPIYCLTLEATVIGGSI